MSKDLVDLVKKAIELKISDNMDNVLNTLKESNDKRDTTTVSLIQSDLFSSNPEIETKQFIIDKLLFNDPKYKFRGIKKPEFNLAFHFVTLAVLTILNFTTTNAVYAGTVILNKDNNIESNISFWETKSGKASLDTAVITLVTIESNAFWEAYKEIYLICNDNNKGGMKKSRRNKKKRRNAKRKTIRKK
jgi:hypothetical protein